MSEVVIAALPEGQLPQDWTASLPPVAQQTAGTMPVVH